MITQFSLLPATCLSRIGLFALVLVGSCLASSQRPVRAQATITVDIVDEKNGQPLPCRVELRDAKGRAQKTRAAMNHLPWSVVDGQFVFRGRPGNYEFVVSSGPEYARGSGGFTLDRDGEGTDVVRLPRYADMASEGWFAGDLLACIPQKELTEWLAAEGLQMSALVTEPPAVAGHRGPAASSSATTGGKQTDASTSSASSASAHDATDDAVVKLANDRWCNTSSYFDDRPGSGLVLHHWQPPAAVPDVVPSSRLLTMAKQQRPDAHAEIVRLWARDTPVWLASGRIDSIQLLSEHLTRDGRSSWKVSDMYHPEPNLFKGPRGPGRLVENLYWQVLETGLRIPPSAGSGVGRSSSPLGYNRVYVAPQSEQPNSAAWWEALRAGRCFVTNGPLLRATVNTKLPGHVFKLQNGERLMLDIALDLTVADPVEYVDVVFNGDAIYHARLDEYAKQGGKIPALEITQSGWLVIRVVTQHEETYRLATTAPYYVEFNDQPRINRAACQLFLDWLESSIAEQQKANPAAAAAAQPYTTAAREFWAKRIAMATADSTSNSTADSTAKPANEKGE